ncbi:MAG: hypothetical protein LQ346_007140 [Caloplaca aetnensis]|nr:MAG: hypothetical protein LQ346_007140 [Caloplaca aetnensis]
MNESAAVYQEQRTPWKDDRGPELLAASIILLVATSLAIPLRYWAQRTIKKQWAPDNVIIFVAAILASAYAIGLLHGPCLGLIKISILLFYRRIFTTYRRTFKIAFYVLGIYTLLNTIATVVTFIVQCLPVAFFWERAYLVEDVDTPHAVKGECFTENIHVMTVFIANTISDVALLMLPAIGLWKLQLPREKKMGLFGVFSLGAFVTCVGVVRIYYGFKATNNYHDDLSWVNADILLWTAVECCVGTICASLPPMAPLLKRSSTPSSHAPPPPADHTGGTIFRSRFSSTVKKTPSAPLWSIMFFRRRRRRSSGEPFRVSDDEGEEKEEDENSLRDLSPPAEGHVVGAFAKETV